MVPKMFAFVGAAVFCASLAAAQASAGAAAKAAAGAEPRRAVRGRHTYQKGDTSMLQVPVECRAIQVEFEEP